MKCQYFLQSQCKSCTLLDKSYEETIILKEVALKKLFDQKNIIYKKTCALENGVSNTRNKAKLAVFIRNDLITFGFYQSNGDTVELEECPLHMEGINSILPTIKDILTKYKIAPYDFKTKSGELKYLLISKTDKDFLLRFVLRSKESLDRLKKAAIDLQDQNTSIKVITANIQPIHQAIIEGEEEQILTKDSIIIHQFDEFKLALGARSFFQVTPEIARKLYSTVAEAIALDKPKSLIDLYCGVGAFSFYAKRTCPDVTGVEISKEAIDCAKKSVELNKSSVQFHAMDAEEFLKKNQRHFEAVLVNPPRRGLNTDILEMLQKMAPEFIYYSSCNAETLARDYKFLEPSYKIQTLQIFDMFPFTTHYETLMCLSKR